MYKQNTVYLCLTELFEIKWSHLTVCKKKKMSLGLLKNIINKMIAQ